MSPVKKIPILACLRILLGIFFVLVGGSKLLAPYQNFLYVVQSYEVFPPLLQEFAARFVPWIEFFLGIFLILGLWSKPVLIALLCLVTGFILTLGQAILRGLPIDSCGCFGSWLPVPIRTMLAIDDCLWLLINLMLIRLKSTSLLSFDNHFAKINKAG